MSSDSSRCVRCIVSGRVQGVWYRAATQREAERLAVHGWAKNLPDGRVEVVIRGPDEAVAVLCAWLWQGPPAARVTSVSVSEHDDDVGPGFSIR